MKKQRIKGFTLIEAMITVAVLAIISAIAAPSLTPIIDSNRASSAATSIQGAILFARSEAIKRNEEVSVCPSTNQSTCSDSTDWQTGWIVYTEINGSHTILRSSAAYSSALTLSGPEEISFASGGYLTPLGSASISSTSGNASRNICLTPIGNSEIKKTSC